MKLTKTLESALREIEDWNGAYPEAWKPKTREKLESLGLVEFKRVNWRGAKQYGLTDAGRAAINGL